MDNDTRTATLTVKGFTPYAQIPKWILRNPELSHGSVRLYGVIMSYADNETLAAFPSRETLAKDMGVTVRSIGSYISELEKAGVMEVERRRNKRTGNFYANHYVLCFNDPATIEPEEEYFPRREEADFPVTKPTTLTKPTSSLPSSPAMTNPLTPSHSDGHTIHSQLGITKDEAQSLVSRALELYSSGDDSGCSDEWERFAEEIEHVTGCFVGDAIANKRWGERLAKMIEEESGRPRYAASSWLAQMVRWADKVPYAA